MKTSTVRFGDDGWIEVRIRPVMQDIQDIRDAGMTDAEADDLTASAYMGAHFVERWKDDGDDEIREGMSSEEFMRLDLEGVAAVSDIFTNEISPFLERFVSAQKPRPSTLP